MKNPKKFLTYLISIMTIILCVTSYLYFKEYKEEQRQFDLFLNHFYNSLDMSITRIDTLLEGNLEGKELNEAIDRLENDLLKTNTIVDNGYNFLSHDIYPTNFFQNASSFLYGVKMSGEFYVPPLSEDDQLDEEELTLLKTLRGYMVDAKNALYSSKTNQENPNLTMSELKEIIITHINKDSIDIYRCLSSRLE